MVTYEISAKELIEYLHNISAAECERRFQRREKRENASTIISTRSYRYYTCSSCATKKFSAHKVSLLDINGIRTPDS
jgi:hypothetical protein